jgi:hypothetical protein
MHKCKTPWGWHTDVETCSSVHYINRYSCDLYWLVVIQTVVAMLTVLEMSLTHSQSSGLKNVHLPSVHKRMQCVCVCVRACASSCCTHTPSTSLLYQSWGLSHICTIAVFTDPLKQYSPITQSMSEMGILISPEHHIAITSTVMGGQNHCKEPLSWMWHLRIVLQSAAWVMAPSIAHVWGWQVGRPPQAPLLRGLALQG